MFTILNSNENELKQVPGKSFFKENMLLKNILPKYFRQKLK